MKSVSDFHDGPDDHYGISQFFFQPHPSLKEEDCYSLCQFFCMLLIRNKSITTDRSFYFAVLFTLEKKC